MFAKILDNIKQKIFSLHYKAYYGIREFFEFELMVVHNYILQLKNEAKRKFDKNKFILSIFINFTMEGNSY